MVDPITVLHLSDTQFGKNHAFGAKGVLPSDSIVDALCERIGPDIRALRQNYGVRIDIVALTGDLTEWGRASEFRQVGRFIDAIADEANLDHSRVVLVPGNHDVNRDACAAYFSTCRADELEPKPPYWPKFRQYADFVNEFYRDHVTLHISEKQPWALFEIQDLKVAVAAINSDMAESHEDDHHFGYAGEEQLKWFFEHLEAYKAKNWLRLAVLHHNPVRGPVDDNENLRDADMLRRYLEPTANVLLHGHTHSGGKIQMLGALPVFSTGSAGVINEARPSEIPNQYQILQILPNCIKQFARCYSIGDRKWMGDNRVSPTGDNWRHENSQVLNSVAATFDQRRLRNLGVRAAVPRRGMPSPSRQANPSEHEEYWAPLTSLERYFSAGSAEGESSFLKDAFVTPDDYVQIISPPPSCPRLLVGKKGSGKSAFIKFLMQHLDAADVPGMLFTPSELKFDRGPEPDAIASFKAKAHLALVRAISSRMLSDFRELLDADAAEFLAGLENDPSPSQSVVRQAVSLISTFGIAGPSLDVSSLVSSTSEVPSASNVAHFTSTIHRSNRLFYLMIDDTDQVGMVVSPNYLEQIWGFILAARSLASECENIKCIVTLRTEVWRRLEVNPRGQRDQIDHIRPLVRLLNPSRGDVLNILERRLELAQSRVEHQGESVYDPFFLGVSVEIPTSDIRSSWPDFLIGRSRGRPRDAIQLVAHLANIANKAKAAKINSEHVAAGMGEFSRSRAHDVAAEVGDECKEFFNIVRSFARVPFKASAERIKKHLMMLPSTMSIEVGGIRLAPDDEEAALKVWAMLFEVGFLNARIADSREKDEYRHIDPASERALISKERWNEMQAIVWEVNPAYRDFLFSVKRNEDHQHGLPPGRRRRKTIKKKRR